MMMKVLIVLLIFGIAVNAFLSVLIIRGIIREGYVALPHRMKKEQMSPHEAAIREWKRKA